MTAHGPGCGCIRRHARPGPGYAEAAAAMSWDPPVDYTTTADEVRDELLMQVEVVETLGSRLAARRGEAVRALWRDGPGSPEDRHAAKMLEDAELAFYDAVTDLRKAIDRLTSYRMTPVDGAR